MKILKTIGIAFLVIIAVGLVAAAFLPKHFQYERSTDINASPEVIYSIINDMKTWEEWGPWKQQDSTMKVTYGEKTEGIDASYVWTSENSGNGTITITEATPPTFQKSRIEFEGQGGGNGWFKLENGEADATKITWGFEFEAAWPFNLFVALSSDDEINNMFEIGLTNLKAMAEKRAAEQPAAGKFMVYTTDFPGKTYLGVREKVNFDEALTAEYFASRYGEIGTVMQKSKIEMDGPPVGIFYTWDENTKETEMAAAIPVKSGMNVNGSRIKTFEVPAGKAYVIDYYGPYTGTGAAHEALDAYLKENGIEAGTPAIEEYVTDPGNEPDSSKWLTKIYYFPKNQNTANQ